jgi:hypothetical protein
MTPIWKSLGRCPLDEFSVHEGLHTLSSDVAVRHLGNSLAHREGIRRWYCLPLSHGGKVIGIVYFGMSHAARLQ